MAVSDVLPGILEVLLDRFLPHESLKLDYFRRLIENNNVICLQEVHGKDEFLQTIQVMGSAIQAIWYVSYQAMQMHVAQPHAFIKDLLSYDAVVTHAITCQGRDHTVIVRSGCRNLVVVNVHFEPELTLRSLRERFCLITPHWPQDPNAIGIIMEDFNICDPEKGRFNFWNQTFTCGALERLPYFILYFNVSLKLLNLATHHWGYTHAVKD